MGDTNKINKELTKKEEECIFLREKESFQKDIEDVKLHLIEMDKKINPTLKLQNGKVHHKSQTDTVKDSWERINVIQGDINKIDKRTVVLQDLEIMFSSAKKFKQSFKKIFAPLGKFLWKLIIILATIYVIAISFQLLFDGDKALYQILKKWIFKG